MNILLLHLLINSFFFQIIISKCSSLSVYTPYFVQCLNSCPPPYYPLNNKCLMQNQYVLNQQVHLCEGTVTPNRKHCCKNNKYPIVLMNGQNFCAECNGQLINDGKMCCDNSEYIEYSREGVRCTKIGTGSCSELKMNSLYKICCPRNLFYHLHSKKCNNLSDSLNCNFEHKICCPLEQKLDYIDGQFQCTNQCQWNQGNHQTICTQKYCLNNQSISEGPYRHIPNSTLISFGSSCCYGLSPDQFCLLDSLACPKVFYNLGWSVCCQSGQYYNINAKICSKNCSGLIVLEFFCLSSETKKINLTQGPPKEDLIGTLCYGKLSPIRFPVCCPQGFYINGHRGCQKCSGRIFLTLHKQICCKSYEYFDQETETCRVCEGKLSKEGTVCCSDDEYIGYSQPGVAFCTVSCPEQNLYQNKYCCLGMNANKECSRKNATVTTCSYFYQVEGACMACPHICSAFDGNNMCSLKQDARFCNEVCALNTVFNSQIQKCLACDTSCQSCFSPLNDSKCLGCKDGYIEQGNRCIPCHTSCLTCMNPSREGCSSCIPDSSRPVLLNGRCVQSCPLSGYYNISLQQCQSCAPGCLMCDGYSQRDCTKCVNGMYLPGNFKKQKCLKCGQKCSKCVGQSYFCIECIYPYILDSLLGTCSFECTQFQQIPIYSPTLKGGLCANCHALCDNCSNHPQNCSSCKDSEHYYLADSQLGIQICLECKPPCETCFSQNACRSCLPGYFFQYNQCHKCFENCQTCYGPKSNNCITCETGILKRGSCFSCESICKTCNIYGQCLACNSPRLLFNGTCVQNCPQKSFKSNDTSCSQCLMNCSLCRNISSCIQCSIYFPYRYKGLCLQSCPLGFYPVGFECVSEFFDPKESEEGIQEPVDPMDLNQTVNIDPNVRIDLTNKSQPIVQITENISDFTESSSQTVANSSKQESQSIILPTIVMQSYTLQETESPYLLAQLIFDSIFDPERISVSFFLRSQQKSIELKSALLTQIYSYIDQKEAIKIGELEQGKGYKKNYKISMPEQKIRDSLLMTIVKLSGSQQGKRYYTVSAVTEFFKLQYLIDPLVWLQYLPLLFIIPILLFSIASKLKPHSQASYANTIVLHTLNYLQSIYFFRFVTVCEPGLYHFLNGFGFLHLTFFPNFFAPIRPENYHEYPAEISLIPDSNFISNAGSSISYLLTILGISIVALLVSFGVALKRKLEKWSYVHEIIRISILLAHLSFQSIIFWSFTYLIQPHLSQPEGTSYEVISKVLSVLFLVFVLGLSAGAFFYYFRSYRQNALEFIYSFREGIHFMLILCQAVVFSLSIGKPLIGLCLIGMEVCWLLINYLLEKKYQSRDERIIEPFRSVFFIFIGYASISFLSYASDTWISIIVITCLIPIILLICSMFQIYKGSFQCKPPVHFTT